jgi:hypothetical protein
MRTNLQIEKLQQYVDIYFEYEEADWTNNISTKKRIETDWCTEQDFG